MLVGFGAEDELQVRALHQFLVADPEAVERLAVELDRLNVLVGRSRAICVDLQFPSRASLNADVIGDGRGQDVGRADGVDGVQSHRGHHVPGRHLPAVFIAGKSVVVIVIERVQDLADAHLRLPGLAGVGVKECNGVAGFVAVHVLADEAGHVRNFFVADTGFGLEEGVELGEEGLTAAEGVDVPLGIVLDEEGGLPGVGFGVVAAAFHVTSGTWIEVRCPCAVGHLGADEFSLRVEEIAVVLRALALYRGIVGVARGIGDVGACPVVVHVLQSLGDGFTLRVGGDVAELAVVGQALEGVVHVALPHHGIGAVPVHAGHLLGAGFRHDAGGVIARHAEGFRALQRPDRHAAGAFFRHADKAHDHGTDALRLPEREAGVQGAKGVPQRKGAVVMLPGFEGMHLLVHAAVLTVHVVGHGGRAHHVVQAAVEDGLALRVVAFDGNLGKFSLPGGFCVDAGGIKVELGHFGLHVRKSVLRADHTNADFDDNGLRRIEVQSGMQRLSIGLGLLDGLSILI